MNVWVLYYRYYDNSGNGVIRAYVDESRAKDDLDLLSCEFDSKVYSLVEVPLFNRPKKRSQAAVIDQPDLFE